MRVVTLGEAPEQQAKMSVAGFAIFLGVLAVGGLTWGYLSSR